MSQVTEIFRQIFSYCIITIICLNTVESYKSINLHEVSFNDLARSDKSAALFTHQILTTVGIIKIKDVPQFQDIHTKAFSNFSSCLYEHSIHNTNSNTPNHSIDDSKNYFEMIMKDGIIRRSIGTKNTNGNKGDFNHPCSDDSTYELRVLIDLTTRQIMTNLDYAYSLLSTQNNNPDLKKYSYQTDKTASKLSDNKKSIYMNHDTQDYIMTPYRTYTDMIDHGEHLEHIHTYYDKKYIVNTDHHQSHTLEKDHIEDSVHDHHKDHKHHHHHPQKTHTVKQHRETMTSFQQKEHHHNHNHPSHLYSSHSSDDSNSFTMDMHIDAGLFIAMTSGYYHTTTDHDNDYGHPRQHIDNEEESNHIHKERYEERKDNEIKIDFDTNVNKEDDEELHHESTLKNGLYIQLPSGEIVHVLTSLQDVIFMVGQGSQQWLSSRHIHPFRPVPHALYLNFDSTTNQHDDDDVSDKDRENIRSKKYLSSSRKETTRTWYGKMILPPLDAVLHNTDITYEEYRQKELRYLQSSHNHPIHDKSKHENTMEIQSFLPLACGSDITHFSLQASTSCTVANTGEKGIKCWAQCMPITNMSCGSQALCIDPATNQEVDGTKMCKSSLGMHACKVECPPSTIPSIDANTQNTSNHGTNIQGNTENSFCQGEGMSMSMLGFVGTSNDDGSPADCINYLFPTWTLNSTFKFIIACLGTLFGGIIVHLLSKYRTNILQLPHTTASPTFKFIGLIFVYTIQIILSYLLMLVAMTYNVYLFLMVCIGLTIGYAYTNIQILKSSSNSSTTGLSSSYGNYRLASSNPDPCCVSDEDSSSYIVTSGRLSGNGNRPSTSTSRNRSRETRDAYNPLHGSSNTTTSTTSHIHNSNNTHIPTTSTISMSPSLSTSLVPDRYTDDVEGSNAQNSPREDTLLNIHPYPYPLDHPQYPHPSSSSPSSSSSIMNTSKSSPVTYTSYRDNTSNNTTYYESNTRNNANTLKPRKF